MPGFVLQKVICESCTRNKFSNNDRGLDINIEGELVLVLFSFVTDLLDFLDAGPIL